MSDTYHVCLISKGYFAAGVVADCRGVDMCGHLLWGEVSKFR
jgi:hypothetical protein